MATQAPKRFGIILENEKRRISQSEQEKRIRKANKKSK
jgi:hypothetical protein